MNETFEQIDRHLAAMESYGGLMEQHKARVLKLYVQRLKEKHEAAERAATAIIVVLLFMLMVCAVLFFKIEQPI